MAAPLTRGVLMGNFYVNYTLRTSDPLTVQKALVGRAAVITPAKDGYVVVFDSESDDQDLRVVEALGAELSSALRCVVLAVLNHDDDVLWFRLFDSGAVLDEYNSCPGYFEGGSTTPEGGNGKTLCKAFGKSAPEREREVEAILHDSSRARFTFEVERHEALTKALGLPDWAVGMSYRYIDNGEMPDGLREDDLLRF
jgi:hypothetical protein